MAWSEPPHSAQTSRIMPGGETSKAKKNSKSLFDDARQFLFEKSTTLSSADSVEHNAEQNLTFALAQTGWVVPRRGRGTAANLVVVSRGRVRTTQTVTCSRPLQLLASKQASMTTGLTALTFPANAPQSWNLLVGRLSSRNFKKETSNRSNATRTYTPCTQSFDARNLNTRL